MTQSLAVHHEFKGTNIKTPFEKMRARAIISAGLDTQGISLINFNLTAFLSPEKRNDAIIILCIWATEPARKQRNKCKAYPEQAKLALYKRVETLRNFLEKRQDLPEGFSENAYRKMVDAINHEINHITRSAA